MVVESFVLPVSAENVTPSTLIGLTFGRVQFLDHTVLIDHAASMP